MSKKCGECEDYYCCKSDSKLRGKYLPKNKKACRDFKPSREHLLSALEQDEKKIEELEDENKQMKSTLRFTATRLERMGEGHREIDYVLKQSEALKGGGPTSNGVRTAESGQG